MDVDITPEALAQISQLPTSMQARVYRVIERLENWPDVSGIKWMTANWKGYARIRTGDYRVIFRLHDKATSDDAYIEVTRIAHRKDAYAE